MNRILTDAQLAAAVARNFYCETFSAIITYMNIPLGTFKSLKSQHSGVWKQMIGAAKCTVAKKPIEDLKSQITSR